MGLPSHPRRAFIRLLKAVTRVFRQGQAERVHPETMEIDDRVQERVTREARAHGPVARGRFRVIVAEPDGDWTWSDHETLKDAQEYADDAYSEAYPNPLAWILDSEFVIVDRGHSVFARR